MADSAVKVITNNKKAYHDYFILEKIEAGIELFGTEVKSIRGGSVNLKDSYCYVNDGEIFIKGMHISPYEKGNIFNKDPLREKKLLLHKREIMRLFGKVKQDGCTLVPLSVYLKNSLVKVEMALCKGKQLHDKRDAAATHDANREILRAMRDKNIR
jgi:SsrA-binding protein